MSKGARAIRGSCHCGQVVFEIAGRTGPMGSCHCSRCRKHTGSAFHTLVLVRRDAFRFVAGASSVRRFDDPDPRFALGRCFCTTCGASLGEPNGADVFPISAALLDDDPGRPMSGHEWVADKAPWFALCDAAPRFRRDFPTKDGPPLEPDSDPRCALAADPPANDATDRWRGSCLCGAIAYSVAGPMLGVGHCHCLDCRKTQGSAFATNGTVVRERFEIERGAEFVAEYASSPGKFRCFCQHCGSKLWARFDAYPAILRIRLGSLDDDPGARPDGHYWLAEKAPWMIVDDVLPHYATEPEEAL